MIVNSHVHMARYGREFSAELAKLCLAEFGGTPCWRTGEPWRPEDFCVSTERLIQDMDRLGIDRAIVLGIAYVPLNAYDPTAAEYLAEEVVGRHPDRLVAFYAADPTGGVREVRRFERAVDGLGLRGLKLLPSGNRVAINDRRIWPLYESAERMGVPVVCHTGWDTLPTERMLDYEHPLFAEDVVRDFPDLKLVLAHTGFQWADEAIWLMAKSPNLYADLAFWPETTPLWRAAQVLSWAKKLGVLDRILWGSDYPFVDFAPGLEYVRRIPDYTRRHELEPYLTEEDLAGVLGLSAAGLIGVWGGGPACAAAGGGNDTRLAPTTRRIRTSVRPDEREAGRA